jgi:lactate dehydrogenase-like 2-hydroxyacid dehydrogenase
MPGVSGGASSAQTTGHVYVTRLLTDDAMERLAALDRRLVVGGEQPPTRSELLRDVAGAAAVVCTLTERIDAEVLRAAGAQLQVVANTAVGFDNIDVPAAREQGVVVTNTPGVLDRATADLTFGLLLAAARRVAEGDRFLRSRTPWTWGPRMMVGLDVSAGATLGIVGFGRIGRAVARRARAFDMRVVATPTRAQLTEHERAATEFLPLPELLSTSDVVSLHCPLTPQTRHLINTETLALMKPNAILVNTARGGVIDTAALVSALQSGQIGGAALDVFEDEPNVDPRLLSLEEVVLTPHLGSAAGVTRSEMCQLSVANATAVLAGRPPITPVPEV